MQLLKCVQYNKNKNKNSKNKNKNSNIYFLYVPDNLYI